MCGIGAIIADPSKSFSPELIRAMMSVMKHRGPDDEGYLCVSEDGSLLCCGGSDSHFDVWENPFPQAPSVHIDEASSPVSTLLGHRRLSIVDLRVSGHQPLCSDDNRYWIVYNGEVYNYPELREELKTLGYHFFSESDTEVILKAYVAWGIDCLTRFNGMWAFIIYDSVQQNFFAARDRFGVKPLYFWRSEAGFLSFSSEIKGFTVLPGWKPILNENRAYDFLVNSLLDHTCETLFSGVNQIPGGHYVSFSKESSHVITPVRWYTPSINENTGSEKSLITIFRDLLEDSVRIRMRSDVPVGSCLSGGLDSSSIVMIMHRLLTHLGDKTTQKVFSASSYDHRWSEKEYSDLIIKNTSIEGHYVYPNSQSLFEELDLVLWHQDEPFVSTSIYAQWCVFHLAHQNGMKVMLDGQGSDEILYGYTDFVYAIGSDLLRHLKLWQFFCETRVASQKLRISWFQIAGQVFYYALPTRLRLSIAMRLLGYKYAPAWIASEFIKDVSLRESAEYVPVASNPSELSRKIQFQTNLPMLLHYEDRNSMAHSVESRIPFTDYRLVEFSFGLPYEVKWRDSISKWILREAMKGILPEAIRTRQDKMGFVTPEELWMGSDNSESFRDFIHQAVRHSGGILNEQICSDFELFLQGKKKFDHVFWRVIAFGKWMKIFKVERNI